MFDILDTMQQLEQGRRRWPARPTAPRLPADPGDDVPTLGMNDQRANPDPGGFASVPDQLRSMRALVKERAPAYGRSIARAPATIAGQSVDALNSLMTLAGAPTSPNPVMGSQWIADKIPLMPKEKGDPNADFAIGMFGPAGIASAMAGRVPDPYATIKAAVKTSGNAYSHGTPLNEAKEALGEAKDLGLEWANGKADDLRRSRTYPVATIEAARGGADPLLRNVALRDATGVALSRQRVAKALDSTLQPNFAGGHMEVGQGAYGAELNPVFMQTLPRIKGALSGDPALRQYMAQAGANLDQEAMAASRFLPQLFKNPKKASALMVEGLDSEAVRKLAQASNGDFVVAAQPGGKALLMPYSSKAPGKFTGEALDRFVRDLVPGAKTVPGNALDDVDRLYLEAPQYSAAGARRLPKSVAEDMSAFDRYVKSQGY